MNIDALLLAMDVPRRYTLSLSLSLSLSLFLFLSLLRERE